MASEELRSSDTMKASFFQELTRFAGWVNQTVVPDGKEITLAWA